MMRPWHGERCKDRDDKSYDQEGLTEGGELARHGEESTWMQRWVSAAFGGACIVERRTLPLFGPFPVVRFVARLRDSWDGEHDVAKAHEAGVYTDLPTHSICFASLHCRHRGIPEDALTPRDASQTLPAVIAPE